MNQGLISRWKLFIAFFSLAVLAFASGCSSQQLEDVQDASSLRAKLCSELNDLAELLPDSAPALEKAREACGRGEDLREIAAAYAGCYEPPAPAQPSAPATAAPAEPAEPAAPTTPQPAPPATPAGG